MPLPLTGRALPAFLLVLPLAGILLLVGCPAPSRQQVFSTRPIVVTSIYPLADWVRQIAGSAVEVYALLPPGASPHTFEPTPQDAERTARASLLVVIGLGLDDWARRLSAGEHTRILVLGDRVATMPNANPDEPHEVGGPDPHVWLDPLRAAQMVAALTDDLTALAPTSQAQIRQRSSAYQTQLQEFAPTMTEACRPYAGRRIVTTHAGYDYFLARCGLPPARVITPFPGKEPSARYLETLARQARQESLRVLFTEPQISPKAAQVLAREIGGQVFLLDPLGSPSDPTRDTYLKVLRFNLAQLLKGLQAE